MITSPPRLLEFKKKTKKTIIGKSRIVEFEVEHEQFEFLAIKLISKLFYIYFLICQISRGGWSTTTPTDIYASLKSQETRPGNGNSLCALCACLESG